MAHFITECVAVEVEQMIAFGSERLQDPKALNISLAIHYEQLLALT